MSAVLKLQKARALLIFVSEKDFFDFGKFLRITNGTNVEALFTADSNAWMYN
jgi:hypothetical protein